MSALSNIYHTLRNYLAEKVIRIRKEWQLYQRSDADHDQILTDVQSSDIRRLYDRIRFYEHHEIASKMHNVELSKITELYRLDRQLSAEPFEFYRINADFNIPMNRIPAPGINILPLEYHRGRIIGRLAHHDFDYESNHMGDTEETETLDVLIEELLRRKYPQYIYFVNKYCRPMGTTNATFSDFNKEQKPYQLIQHQRKQEVLTLVISALKATPYRPLHFVDTQFAKMPLSTGTGYHNRFSYKRKAHAKYSHPPEYRMKPTSKGYFYNASYDDNRRLVHLIKLNGYPFYTTNMEEKEILSHLNNFVNRFPTLLFTRNHISDRTGILKVRPVYCVDELFLLLECMALFALLVQSRKSDCCIMYGLETFRGANIMIDRAAMNYNSYAMIDWSAYDQRLPWCIIEIYYTDFLRKLIIISHGYQPTYEYPNYPDLSSDKLYSRMDNLLHFITSWYFNMTFVTADGFAYRRLYAGVISGQLPTQHLDSFGNLFMFFDALLEFEASPEEIATFKLYIMGDDNAIFSLWPITKLQSFITFFEKYALLRYGMILSTTKSIITALRNKIETLGYQCNYGIPKRDVGKLIAQLCYPEHGMLRKYMSARAIGIAYAACGMDTTFHQFCKDVFHTYLPYSVVDVETLETIKKYLPGQYHLADDVSEFLQLEHFPTIWEVKNMISHYHGPLKYEPKWNYAHFIDPPDLIPPNAKTMEEYELENNIQRRVIPHLS